MRRLWFLVVAMAIIAACGDGTVEPAASAGGGGGGEPAPADGGGGGSSGNVVNRQPAGTGYVSVDGQEYTLTTPGGLACEVGGEEFAFSFIQGDNEVTLGGGATISNGDWFGSVSLQLFGEDGVTQYSAKILDNPSGIAVDGSSVSYSGPMERTDPAPPGELPVPVDVGDGVISATCG